MHMRGLIFDLDDTLYPRERFVRSGFAAVARHVAGRFGVPVSQAMTILLRERSMGRTGELQTLCASLELPAEIVPDLLDLFRTHVPDLWLYHDAEAVLRQLRADGWRLAILTNGLPHVQAAKIRVLGLRPLIDHIVFAAEYAADGKPHPDCFAEVLRRFRLPASSAVMVGDDRQRDILGARACGLHTIELARGGGNPASPADLVLGFLSHVPAAAVSLIEREHAHAA
jgi:putative hydrolase of the HAD superfamily